MGRQTSKLKYVQFQFDGSNAVDPRHRAGRFRRRSLDITVHVGRLVCPDFEILDARIATALKNYSRFNVKQKISLEEQKAQNEYRFVRGRQIVYMIQESTSESQAHMCPSLT